MSIKELKKICLDLAGYVDKMSGVTADTYQNLIDPIYKDAIFFEKVAKMDLGSVKRSVILTMGSKYNHESGFYIKRNYDYDEGWTAFLDAYRAGKVKSLQEWVKQKRQIKATASNWKNQIFTDNDKEYKISNIVDFISEQKISLRDLDVKSLVDINLNLSDNNHFTEGDKPGSSEFQERAEQVDLKFPIIAIESSDGIIIADGLHRLWKAWKLGNKMIKAFVISQKDLNKIPHNTLNKVASKSIKPIDSYCDSKATESYWDELEPDDSEAVKDFEEYIKEIKC